MSHEEFIQIVKTAIYEECTDGRVVPSILIAHAAIISDWGRSEVAMNANNLYNVTCSSILGSLGAYETTITTETSSGKVINTKVRYRKYASWHDSVVDYIARMLDKEKYFKLTELQTISELVKCYVQLTDRTTPHLDSRILNVIKMYRLIQYDEIRGRYNPFNIAQIGDRGEIVRWLQYELRTRGYYDKGQYITEFFDYTMMNSIRAYQIDHGLEPHGVVDVKTLRSFLDTIE